MKPVSTINHCNGSESVYSWFDPVKWPEHWPTFMVKPFLQQHLSWVEMYPGGGSQHSVALYWAQNVCTGSYGLIQ